MSLPEDDIYRKGNEPPTDEVSQLEMDQNDLRRMESESNGCVTTVHPEDDEPNESLNGTRQSAAEDSAKGLSTETESGTAKQSPGTGKRPVEIRSSEVNGSGTAPMEMKLEHIRESLKKTPSALEKIGTWSEPELACLLKTMIDFYTRFLSYPTLTNASALCALFNYIWTRAALAIQIEPELFLKYTQDNTETMRNELHTLEQIYTRLVTRTSLEKTFNFLFGYRSTTELEFAEYVILVQHLRDSYSLYMSDPTRHAIDLCCILNYISERAGLGVQIQAEELLIFTQLDWETMRNGLIRLEHFNQTLPKLHWQQHSVLILHWET